MVNNNYTAKLTANIEVLRNMKLSNSLIEQVKQVLLDYYCVSISGSQTKVSQTVYQYFLETYGEGDFKAIGYDIGLSKENVAFLNGTSAHSLDFDDGHTDGSIHPGAVVISAFLASSQKIKNLSFEDLIKSILVGYDICLRVSSAIHPSSRKRGFHNTPVAGILGAAATVSYVYGFNQVKIQQTLGIAASFAGGLFAFLGTGSDVKRIHPGQAARDAIIAAELVNRGITGPQDVLENENGFFHAFAGNEISEERMLKDLGNHFEIMDVYFKPYPCCRHLHVVIDTIYEMKNKYTIDVNKIIAIRVGVNTIASFHHHKNCQTLLDAQMSIPFALAAALLNKNLTIDTFNPQNAGGKLWEMCNLTEVYVDDEADELYPEKRAARVEIEMEDSRKLIDFIDTPLGEPEKPMTIEQLSSKFLNNCSPILGQKKARDFIDNMKQLEVNHRFLFQL